MSTIKPANLSAAKQQVKMYCQQGNFLKARDVLDTLVRCKRMDAESFSMLGSICGQLGAFEEAARNLQESICLQPNVPQVHFGLGISLSKLGRFAEAEVCFKKVIKLSPTNLQAVLELAIVELNLNKLLEAETNFNRIVASNPKELKALMGLARVYQSINKSEFAINYYKRALNINPKIANAHQQLGNMYMNLGQTDLAEASYKKALKIDPNNIAVHLEIGQLYLRTNFINKAKVEFEKALSIQPSNLDAITAVAQLKEQSGDIEAAYDLIMPHINEGVSHVDMGILFSRICKHYNQCDTAAKYLEQLLACSEDTIIRKCKLNFALGKLYDGLKRYDDAFLCFKKGNDLKGDTLNQVEHTFCIDTLIKSCDWNFFIKAPRSTQSTERPVFIVGMPRSGTTLTEQILCSHPNVFGAGEILTFPNIILNLPKYLGEGSAYPDNLKNLTTEILDTFSNTYLDEINKLDDKAPRTLDKTLANFLYLGLISLMFPNARVIYCKRDPRDTCLSIYFQNFDESHNYSTTLENLAFYYEEYDRLMKHWKSILKIPIIEIQYEDIVKDQEKMSREIIDFVGLEWDESVLKFYENKRSVVTASYDQVRQKIYTKSTARWKNYEKHIAPLIDALDL